MDESDGGGTDGGGAGGTGATGGAGGTGATGGAGGTGATGGAAGSGGSAGYVPYDSQKFPVTKLATSKAPVLLSADETDVYYTVEDEVDAPLTASPVAGGAPSTLPPTLEKPRGLAAAGTSQFVFIVGGRNTGSDGSLVRTAKAGGVKEEITVTGQTFGVASGIFVATDGFAYVSFATDSTNTVALARFVLGPNVSAATALLTATSAETGGEVVASGSCVYWISNGDISVLPTGGGERKPALATPVTDAVGLAADAVNFYYTRADGTVWQRKLSNTTCDGNPTVEQQVASGFVGMGKLIRFRNAPIIAWAATGNAAANYDGGGVFIRSVSGGAVTQIAPKDSGPAAIGDAAYDVVFATTTGEIRKVPKPQ